MSNFGNANHRDSAVVSQHCDSGFTDSLIISKRWAHTFHIGFQYMRERINPFYAGNYGRTGDINFDGRWTAGPGTLARCKGQVRDPRKPTSSSDSLHEVQRGVDTGTWGQRSSVISAYFADEWRASSSLTVNAGLRYETHTPWVEVYDRMTNFAPFSGEIQSPGRALTTPTAGLFTTTTIGVSVTSSLASGSPGNPEAHEQILSRSRCIHNLKLPEGPAPTCDSQSTRHSQLSITTFTTA